MASENQIYDLLMDSLSWPHEDMLAFQQHQLVQLVHHARENVPYYRHRLDGVVTGDGAINWQRWRNIPILTRHDVQENSADVTARQLPPGHGRVSVFKSSGSTSRPISVASSTLMSHVNQAADHRFFTLNEIPLSARRAYTRDTLPDGKPFASDLAHFPPPESGSSGKVQGPLLINRRLDVNSRLDALQDHGIEVLIDFPTATELLAHHNLRRARPVPLSHVVGFGMGFTPDTIALIERSFGAKVHSTYACTEAGALAYQCPQSLNFHVNTELVLMEKDDTGNGIIVTPFYQAAQPFIRYRLDDTVHLAPACSCGHRHLTITQISGKSDPLFHFPDGVQIVPFERSLGAMQAYGAAMAVQLAQTAANQLEFRYVARTDVTDAMKQELTDFVQSHWHRSLQVSFRRMDNLPVNSGGKQQRFVREWQPAQM